MGTVTLNDGTVYTGYCYKDDTYLWVFVYGVPLSSLYENFTDPEKSVRITEFRFEKENVYENFTHLFSIRENNEEMVTVGMRRE